MKNERYLIKKFKRNSIKICLILVGLLVSLPTVMGAYYVQDVYYKLDDITVEIGDNIPQEIINNIRVMSQNNDLDIESNAPVNKDGSTKKIGKYSYYLVYNDKEKKLSIMTGVKANVMVVDTIKPVLTEREKNKEFEYGSKINADDLVDCYDLSGCSVSFTSDIDSYKSGTYTVDIVAVDGANNKSYITTSFIIKDKPVFNYYGENISYINNNNYNLNSNLSLDDKVNLRNNLVNFALQFVGNPYVYGGTSLTNGTDCSGFTMSVYANYGYMLPRIASNQDFVGISVNYDELLPGDIIVYHYSDGGGHVGIYVGNGMMVHAGTSATGITYVPIFDGYRTYRRIIY